MTPVRYDVKRDYLVCGDRAIRARRHPATIFFTLAAARGRWIGVNQLIESVWPDPDHEPDQAQNQILVQVYKLRRFLADSDLAIENWWGQGFRLVGREGLEPST